MQVILPISVRIDNQGAINLASNLVTNKRSKHIDVRYHLIKDFANKEVIKLECIGIKHNLEGKGNQAGFARSSRIQGRSPPSGVASAQPIKWGSRSRRGEVRGAGAGEVGGQPWCIAHSVKHYGGVIRLSWNIGAVWMAIDCHRSWYKPSIFRRVSTLHDLQSWYACNMSDTVTKVILLEFVTCIGQGNYPSSQCEHYTWNYWLT